MNGFDRSEGWDDGYAEGVKDGRIDIDALIADLEAVITQSWRDFKPGDGKYSTPTAKLCDLVAKHKRGE